MIASVLVSVIRPAATLVNVRSPPDLPILTVEVGAVPAKPLYVTPLIVASVVATAAAVSESEPKATLLSCPARAPLPIATALSLVAFPSVPRTTESFAIMPFADVPF